MLLRAVLGRSICKGTWISDVTKVVGAKLALPQPEGSLTSSGFPLCVPHPCQEGGANDRLLTQVRHVVGLEPF